MPIINYYGNAVTTDELKILIEILKGSIENHIEALRVWQSKAAD